LNHRPRRWIQAQAGGEKKTPSEEKGPGRTYRMRGGGKKEKAKRAVKTRKVKKSKIRFTGMEGSSQGGMFPGRKLEIARGGEAVSEEDVDRRKTMTNGRCGELPAPKKLGRPPSDVTGAPGGHRGKERGAKGKCQKNEHGDRPPKGPYPYTGGRKDARLSTKGGKGRGQEKRNGKNVRGE